LQIISCFKDFVEIAYYEYRFHHDPDNMIINDFKDPKEIDHTILLGVLEPKCPGWSFIKSIYTACDREKDLPYGYITESRINTNLSFISLRSPINVNNITNEMFDFQNGQTYTYNSISTLLTSSLQILYMYFS